MQNASVNLTRALTGGEVTWDKPRVFADWDRTGYGATGSVDDLSDQIGRPTTFTHFLDDGYPDKITFVAGIGTPVLESPLVNGGMGVSGYRLDRASQYFSPFRSDSPLYQYARDVAPVKVDVGAVGASGLEYIRVFTGQMAATPLNGQQATLQAMSANRLKMAKSVQPPNITKNDALLFSQLDSGLTAAWPVTWAMHTCGVYPSPPPVSGARYWAPLHGGSRPYLPAQTLKHRAFSGLVQSVDLANTFPTVAGNYPPFATVLGPYVGGAFAGVNPTGTWQYLLGGGIMYDDQLAPGADFFSQAGSTGKIQFYVRGDAVAVNSAPGGSGSLDIGIGPVLLAGVTIYNNTDLPAGQAYVACGIRASDRKSIVTLYDGTHTATVLTSNPLPTDSAWHLVGAAWDIASGTLWLNIDGFVSTFANPPMTTANLPATNSGRLNSAAFPEDGPESPDWDILIPGPDFGFIPRSIVPLAEFQFSTGYAANPSHLSTWIDTGWTKTATVYPSAIDLVAVAEPVSREAWELVSSYAQAELAALRTDENDNVTYLPLPWWALTAQQVTSENLSQSRHTASTKITYDPSTIRNSVTAQYNQTTVDTSLSAVYTQTTAVAIPPGTTNAVVQLQGLVTQVPTGYLIVLSADQISGVDPTNPGLSYVSFNTAPDGSGTYADTGPLVGTGVIGAQTGTNLRAQIIAWDSGSILVQFTNQTGVTQYVANNATNGLVFMSLGAHAIQQVTSSVYVADADSIATRGERNLQVTLGTQTAATTAAIANALLGDLAQPKPSIENIEIFGDPRRQPGDLVGFSDADNTGISGLWRYRSIQHTLDGASYKQTVTMRRGYLVGVWDTDTWGDVIWGE